MPFTKKEKRSDGLGFTEEKPRQFDSGKI